MKIINQIFAVIRSIISNREYKKIFENLISLSGLQIASYILPLITLPYLVRVLGPDKYGLVVFATALVTYFIIFTSYGFNFSATRDVALNRDNKEKLSIIFNSVMISKLVLLLISFLALVIIVFSVPQFKKDWLVYFLSFGLVIGNAFFPIWFFQGIEKMKYITILNLLAQSIFTVSIFIFIRTPEDYILVPLINSLGMLLAGFWGFRIAIKYSEIKLKFPGYGNIKFHLKEGWHLFLSNAAISLYTTSNTFILGILTNTVTVSYYAIAEKIITAANGLIYPISQAVYPYITRIADQSKEMAINFIRKTAKIVTIIGFSMSIFIFIFAGLIVETLFGSQYSPSITVLRILAFLPLIVGLSNVFGIQTMLTFNYKAAFSRIILGAGIINVFLALILVPLYQEIGIAISFLTAETLITISMLLYLQHKDIKILGFKDG